MARVADATAATAAADSVASAGRPPHILVVGDELASSGGGAPGWVSALWPRYFAGKVDVFYRTRRGLCSRQALGLVEESVLCEPQLWWRAGAVIVCVGLNDAAVVLDDSQPNRQPSEPDDFHSAGAEAPPALGETVKAEASQTRKGHCRTSFGAFDKNVIALVEAIRNATNPLTSEVVLVSPAPVADERHRRFLKSRGAPLHQVNALSKLFAAASKRVAASMSLYFINLFDGLIAAAEEVGGGDAGGQNFVISPTCATFLGADGVQLSARGHAWLARALEQFIVGEGKESSVCPASGTLPRFASALLHSYKFHGIRPSHDDGAKNGEHDNNPLESFHVLLQDTAGGPLYVPRRNLLDASAQKSEGREGHTSNSTLTKEESDRQALRLQSMAVDAIIQDSKLRRHDREKRRQAALEAVRQQGGALASSIAAALNDELPGGIGSNRQAQLVHDAAAERAKEEADLIRTNNQLQNADSKLHYMDIQVAAIIGSALEAFACQQVAATCGAEVAGSFESFVVDHTVEKVNGEVSEVNASTIVHDSTGSVSGTHLKSTPAEGSTLTTQGRVLRARKWVDGERTISVSAAKPSQQQQQQGSLLQGSYDEDEQQRLFKESVEQWRIQRNGGSNGGGASKETNTSPPIGEHVAPTMPSPSTATATASAAIQVEDDTAAPPTISEASLTELLEQYDLEAYVYALEEKGVRNMAGLVKFGTRASDADLTDLGISNSFFRESFREMIAEYGSLCALGQNSDSESDDDAPTLPKPELSVPRFRSKEGTSPQQSQVAFAERTLQRSTFAWSEDVDLTMAGDSYARNVVIAPSVEWRSDHSSAELSVNENLPDFARKSRGNRAHMPGKGAAEPTGHSKQVLDLMQQYSSDVFEDADDAFAHVQSISAHALEQALMGLSDQLCPSTVLPLDVREKDFDGGRVRGAVQVKEANVEAELGYIAELILCSKPPIEMVVVCGPRGMDPLQLKKAAARVESALAFLVPTISKPGDADGKECAVVRVLDQSIDEWMEDRERWQTPELVEDYDDDLWGFGNSDDDEWFGV